MRIFLTFFKKKFIWGGRMSRRFSKSIQLIFILFIINCSLIILNTETTNHELINVYNSTESTKNDIVDWLLMFYMCGDIEWELHVVDSINELESGYTPGNVEVVLMIDRHPDYDKSAGNWSETRYYHLMPGDDPMTIESELIQSLGEKDMGDPLNLRNFVTWAFDNYPADKTALIIFGHGGSLSGLCYDFSSDNSHLTLDEVQQAMNGYHIDLLATESCGMGMLEIAYEWSSFTDYYLADQKSMVIEALDYKAIIEELCSNSLMEPWELGEVFCQTYLEHNPYPSHEMYALINCSCLPRLISKLDSLATNLSALSIESLEYLSLIRENMYYDSYHRKPDIQSMIDVIRSGFPSNNLLLQALDEFEIEYNKAIMYKIQGKYSTTASGLGIFFPRDKSKVWDCTEYLGLETGTILDGIDFIDNSLWDEFLLIYLEVADNITYSNLVLQEITIYTHYQVNLDRETVKYYYFYVNEPGIYNVTLSSLINDPGLSVINGYNSMAVLSDYVYSGYTNPEESTIEQIIYWLNTGYVLICVSSITATANGTLYVSKASPIPLQINEEIAGEFPYTLGYIPPAAIYNYYKFDLEPGNYTLKIDIDWPVGLEVFIIDSNKKFLLTEFYCIPGKDFFYNLTILTPQKITIGFGSYTGTGVFTFELISERTNAFDLQISFAFIIMPIILTLVFKIKKNRNDKIRIIKK